MNQDVTISKALNSISTQLGGLTERQYNVIGNHLYLVYGAGFNENNYHKLHSKPVIQYKNGIEVKRYKSAKEAATLLGVHHKSIERAARNKKIMKTCKGYTWEYDKDIR
jgi:hypothetical protein